MKAILVILISLCFTQAVLASQCVPSHNSCDFYLCLEQEKQCGYKGFPLRYGYRFCHNFLGLKVKSEALTNWLNDTRLCLQERLNQATDYTCHNMFWNSIQDHVSCYSEKGYCELNRSEKRFVKKLILKEFLSAPIYIIKNAKAFFKGACR